MKQPKGFTLKGEKELVYKLNKSLYDLNLSPKMWYQKIDLYIQQLGCVRSQANHYVYRKKVGDHFIYVVLYVKDMLLVKKNVDLIKEVKTQLSSKFNMRSWWNPFHS